MARHGLWTPVAMGVLLIAPLARGAPAPANDIDGFLKCANTVLQANPAPGKHSVADTVSCLPKECTVTLTNSIESAQKACMLGEVNLPRVIFECPGGKDGAIKFRPSFLMCPLHSRAPDLDGKTPLEGVHHAELGHDTMKVVLSTDPVKESTGALRFADVPINPALNFAPGGTFTPITRKDVLDIIEKEPSLDHGSKNCNAQCHRHPPVDPKTGAMVNLTNADIGKDYIAKPFSPFAEIPDDIVFNTTPPGTLVPADATKRKGYLAGFCAKMKTNLKAIGDGAVKDGNPNGVRDAAIALDLCNAIAAMFTPK